MCGSLFAPGGSEFDAVFEVQRIAALTLSQVSKFVCETTAVALNTAENNKKRLRNAWVQESNKLIYIKYKVFCSLIVVYNLLRVDQAVLDVLFLHPVLRVMVRVCTVYIHHHGCIYIVLQRVLVNCIL